MSAHIRFDGEIITSRQNRRVVELMKLDDRRAREKTRTFRLTGSSSFARPSAAGWRWRLFSSAWAQPTA